MTVTFTTATVGTASVGASAPAVAGGGTVASKGVDTLALLAELVKLAETFQAQHPRGLAGVSDANGAPALGALAALVQAFSPDDMALALQGLRSKTQEGQLKTAQDGINITKVKLDAASAESLKKVEDWIAQSKEAAAKEKAAQIAGMAGSIAGFIAAVIAAVAAIALTVVTFGAAGPLAAAVLIGVVAMATIGLGAASVSLASNIRVSQGGEPINLAQMCMEAITASLISNGMSKDEAAKAGKVLSGLVGMMTMAFLVDPGFGAQMVTGISEMMGADAQQAAIIQAVFTAITAITVMVVMCVATGGAAISSAISGIAKTISAAGAIAQAAASAVSGVAGITQGSFNIAAAYDTRAADTIMADKERMSVFIAKFQQQMEEGREELKKVIEEIMEGMNLVSQMINSSAQNRSQIASNLSAKGPTI
ncbi:MAG: type III secretion system translocon subunit SctE [Ramlibacter sp.]